MSRSYNLSDPKMIQFSSAYRLVFVDHQAEFTTFDPDFATPFETDWNTAISASVAVPTEESRNDLQADMTAKVNDTMRLSRLKYHEVAYFVRKAFPTNTDIQGLFGLNDYDKAATDQAVMRPFLHRMWNTAVNVHKAPLLAAGYTQLKIDAIATLRDELGTSDSQQDHFSMTSPEDTEARINTHNATWNFAQQVNAAAKVIYAENPVLYNLFLFPRRTENPTVFNVLGTVSEMGSGNILADVAVSIAALGFTTTTDEDGNYGFASVGAGMHMVTFELAGYQSQTIPLTVVDPSTPTVFNVQLMRTPPMP